VKSNVRMYYNSSSRKRPRKCLGFLYSKCNLRVFESRPVVNSIYLNTNIIRNIIRYSNWLDTRFNIVYHSYKEVNTVYSVSSVVILFIV